MKAIQSYITLGVMGLVLACPNVTQAVGMLAPPVPQGDREAGLMVDIKNTIEYEKAESFSYSPADFEADFEIERQILSVYFGYKAFFAGIGLIKDSEKEGGAKGDGTVLGLGLRSRIWNEGANSVAVYGQFARIEEEYDEDYYHDDYYYYDYYHYYYDGPIDGHAEATELLLGVVGCHSQDNHTLYAGLEIVPYSDIEISGIDDIDRANMFSLKAGGCLDVAGFLLNVDLQLMGTESIRFGVGRKF